MEVRERYVEILAKELAVSAVQQKAYKDVTFTKKKGLKVSFKAIKNRPLGKKVEKLNSEENKYFTKKFHETMDTFINVGMKRTKLKKEVESGVPKKWD